jgi:hypothetical protein
MGLFQSEGDIGDMAESFQGIHSSMRLSVQEKALCKENLKFFIESSKMGKEFIDQVRKVIVRHKLDIVVLDPITAFMGDDINEGKAVNHWCRVLLDPMLKETGCAAILVHHEGKPKAKEVTDGQTFSDLMYSGTGSAHLVNYVRAVLNIRRESKDKPVFSFNLTKRGEKAGMRTIDGKPTLTIKLKHADDRVFWEMAPMVDGFELLKVGQQYQHFSSKPIISRKALLDELTRDYNLQMPQAESLIKALVTNGIMRPKKVGPSLFYEGTKCD